MPSDSRGSVLLEAIVALSILGTAGLALVGVVQQAVATTRHAREAEERMVAADRFLHAVALWPVVELDRRLGNRPNGRWRLEIQRLHEAEYAVAIYDSVGRAPLLSTRLIRRPSGP